MTAGAYRCSEEVFVPQGPILTPRDIWLCDALADSATGVSNGHPRLRTRQDDSGAGTHAWLIGYSSTMNYPW